MTREPRVRKQALEPIANIEAVIAADVHAFTQTFVAGREPLVAIARAAGTSQTSAAAGAGRRAIAELI